MLAALLQELDLTVAQAAEAAPAAAAASAENFDAEDARLEADLLSLASLELDDNSDVLSGGPLVPENAVEVPRVAQSYLVAITDNWKPERKVGAGGFADVYLGITRRAGKKV